MEGLVTLDNIQSGTTYYKVYKFAGYNGWIESFHTVGRVFNYVGEKSLWVHTTSRRDHGGAIRLSDAGIQENTYNMHRTFHTEDQALAYLNS